MQVITDLVVPDVLAIDDLGKEGAITGNRLTAWISLLSKRNDGGKLTLATTNLTPKEIESGYDASLASRFGNEQWVHIVVTGRDRRTR